MGGDGGGGGGGGGGGYRVSYITDMLYSQIVNPCFVNPYVSQSELSSW